MPRIFKGAEINAFDKDKEVQKDYFDRHAPVIVCENSAKEGEKFKVNIRVGSDYVHPDDGDHFIGYIQLWNREMLLAEVKIFPGTMGNKPSHAEVDFYIIPKVSMNLTAMSYCTKHGLWQSEPKEVAVIHNSQCTQ
jgi:superoxide reductase